MCPGQGSARAGPFHPCLRWGPTWDLGVPSHRVRDLPPCTWPPTPWEIGVAQALPRGWTLHCLVLLIPVHSPCRAVGPLPGQAGQHRLHQRLEHRSRKCLDPGERGPRAGDAAGDTARLMHQQKDTQAQPSKINPHILFAGGPFACQDHSRHKNPRGSTKALQSLRLPVCCLLQPRRAKVEAIQGERHQHPDGEEESGFPGRGLLGW